MKKYWFWILFLCVNIALGTVLVRYEGANRRKDSVLIAPYLEGYSDSLQDTVQTAGRLTGSKDEIRWQLGLLEEKLKMCSYYVKTWGDRGGDADLAELYEAYEDLDERVKDARKAVSLGQAEVDGICGGLAGVISQSAGMKLIPEPSGTLAAWLEQKEGAAK